MTQFLPPNLLALFAPREPVPYLAPVDKLTTEKRRKAYTGLADYLTYFEDPEDTPAPVHIETKVERLERKRREKAEQAAYKLEQDLALWDPHTNSNASSNPYKTLFVGRVSYDTTESKLRREFEAYGKIKSIKMINDVNTSKPRGYAFIEYEEESDMHAAYKRADGKKIDGRRVVVDIERGRTIEGWKPRRLGGGKGGRPKISSLLATTTSSQNTVDSRSHTKTSNYSDDHHHKSEHRKSSRDRKRSRSRSRDRKKRSKSRDRNRSRSRERVKKSRRSSRSRDRKERKRSRSRDNGKHIKQENDNNGFNHHDNGYYAYEAK